MPRTWLHFYAGMIMCCCLITSRCERRIVCSVAVESSASSPGTEYDAGISSASPGITGIGGNGMSGSSDTIMSMIIITGGKRRRGGTVTGGTGGTGATRRPKQYGTYATGQHPTSQTGRCRQTNRGLETYRTAA